MSDGRAAQLPVLQIVPPGNDVSAGNFPKFIRPFDPDKFYKILKGMLIRMPRLRIVNIGEPFDPARS